MKSRNSKTCCASQCKGGPEVDAHDQFLACLFGLRGERIEKLISAVCMCLCMCVLGVGRLFNISKVSSRDVQRHEWVTGDADSSVNSAGG